MTSTSLPVSFVSFVVSLNISCRTEYLGCFVFDNCVLFFVFVCSGSILKKLLHTGNSFKVNTVFTSMTRSHPATYFSSGLFLYILSYSFIPLTLSSPCLDPLWGDPSLPAVATGPEGQLCWGAVSYLCLSGARIPCCALLQRALHPWHHHLQPLLQPPWWWGRADTHDYAYFYMCHSLKWLGWSLKSSKKLLN